MRDLSIEEVVNMVEMLVEDTEVPPAPPACGTDAGWHRHHYHREAPCDACRSAHVRAIAAWRVANPEAYRAQQARRRARQRRICDECRHRQVDHGQAEREGKWWLVCKTSGCVCTVELPF